MSIQSTIGTALYARLTTTGGTALYGARVYERQAPAGAALPYVIFDFQSGGALNLTPTRHVDARYVVACIAANPADARTGADYIESALVGGELSASGWVHVATQQESLVSGVQNVEGRQFWRDGATYRLRFDQSE
jgi:hypothetical protein